MRNYRSIVVLALLISSCTTGIDFSNVDYSNLFHDDNSKVWVVNKVTFDGAVISSNSRLDKDIIIFHQNGVCDFIPLKNLGTGKSKKGKFNIDSQAKEVRIDFPKESWLYTMYYIFEDSISLKPTKESASQLGMQLKPFMEL
tara:strand:+ start:657 stop:1082 length:426 start_codon:yes stop_codon:yes gene_type:complete